MGLMNNGRVNMVITNHSLRYTFHKNASSSGLVTYGEVELPNGTIKDGTIANKSAFLEAVNLLVHQQKWKRKKLYFSLPDDTVVVRKLQIPAALSKEEAMGYVNTQIGNSLYLPFANPALAIEFLDNDRENREILLFAYPKEKITAFVAIFEEVGLKPVVADLTSLAVYRYYYLHQPDEKEHILLIHWDRDALVLTVFQQHKAIFTRHMKIEMVETPSEDKAMDTINEYITEINRIIDFYQYSITKGEERINKLLLSGDFPFLSAVQTALMNTVTIPIHYFQNEELPKKYIDVLGLALKQDV
ncbi:type IV pilus biogenesis protein PilM [Lentibacillus sp. Marseille-P4043]|uniref:type IV pilus biogenesis protein PilM n=1 Tax=Lentibacillus sp. Marseille-P4043 TaxID=2040293 RepID=UPI000D0B393C|nr:pilus assembly protein PilM [Lentibacillus sp. Marseille-P4043]